MVPTATLSLGSETFSLFVNSIQAIESPGKAVSKTGPESVHFAPVFTTTAFVPATGIPIASSLASLWSPTPVRFPRHGSDHVTSQLPHLSLPSCPLQRRKSRLRDMIWPPPNLLTSFSSTFYLSHLVPTTDQICSHPRAFALPALSAWNVLPEMLQNGGLLLITQLSAQMSPPQKGPLWPALFLLS